MSTTDLYNNLIVSKNDLIRDFQKGCKKRNDFKIGIEYERLLVNKKTLRAVSYYGEEGLYRLLRQIAFKYEWNYLTDFSQVTGLKKGSDTITLEPGGQFEISLSPKKTIQEIEKEINRLDKKITSVAKNLNILFLNYAISPLSNYSEIPLIPKKRYILMSKMLPGDLLSSMMKETASIQVSMDYESEEDAMKKLRLSLKLSPVLSAMFANSPVYNAKDSGYKSYRALCWLFTDNKRCGLIDKALFDNNREFSFNDYATILLNVPLLYIVRGNQVIEINNKIDFLTFIKEGYENYAATIEDFKLHANLYFPEARLNNYIEIRNHDCQKGAMKYAIPAVYKGLFYSSDSMAETMNLFSSFSYEDFSYARECVPKLALFSRFGKYKILDIAKEILKISYNYLNKEGKGEQKYLEPLIELISEGLCPADLILRNWYGKYSLCISKLILDTIE